MEKLVLTLHIIVCVILVLLVLLQSGKEGMGVIFGGGSSSLFGSSGAGGILVKLTAFVAVIFLATSLGYNLLTSVKTSAESTIVDIVIDDPSAPPKPDAPGGADPSAAPAAPTGDSPAPAGDGASGMSAPAEGASSASQAASPAAAPTANATAQ